MAPEDHFVPVQHAYKAGHRSRNAKDAERARANDNKSHATLKKLLKQPGNIHCADCTSRHAGWGVLPWGTFVCIDCAQVHRLIGKHVSQTKGINTNTYLWHDDEIAVMQHFGNERANCRLLGTHPAGINERVAKNATPAEKERFVRSKYERMQWFSDRNHAGGALVAERASTPPTKTRPQSEKQSRSTTKRVPTAPAPDLLSFDVIETKRVPVEGRPVDFFAQFGTRPTTCNRPPHVDSTPPQVPQCASEAQVHASKASNIMAAFRKPSSSNQQCSASWAGQQPGFHTHGQQPVRPGFVAHNQKNSDPFNTGFFESFGLSAAR
jgi:hypothetical protein